METVETTGEVNDYPVALSNIRSFGHNPLGYQEMHCFEHLLDAYDVLPSEKDNLLFQWSDGKQNLMSALGGHTLEADAEYSDTDLFNRAMSVYAWDWLWTINDRLDNSGSRSPRCGLAHQAYLQCLLNNKLPDGQKASKFYAKYIENEGDKKRFLEEYSRAIASAKAKGRIRLSVSPIELLMISDSAEFSSCHSIGHEYSVGNFSYLIDQHTVVMYYTTKNEYCELLQETWPVKSWRQLAYIDTENGSGVVSRQYPNDREPLAFTARQLLFRKLAERLGVDPDRTIGKRDPDFKNSGDAYLDYASFRVVKLKALNHDPRIHLPGAPVHIPKYRCGYCDGGLLEDDVFYSPGGEQLCETCYSDRFADCSGRRCEQVVDTESATYIEGLGWYCEDCLERYFGRCSRCEENIHLEDLTEWGYDWYCESCLDDVGFFCTGCGELTDIDEGVKIDGDQFCKGCAEDRDDEASV